MRIGVICPSEIAYRRFMPALKQIKEFDFIGIATYSSIERFGHKDLNEEEIIQLNNEKCKATKFIDEYGGKLFSSYEEIVSSEEIEALYIPLPPALHYRWAKQALENGKHVLVEKPSTINCKQTEELVNIARKNNVALHENYMFVFHKQIEQIKRMVEDKQIGDVRLSRVYFGFPRRASTDFRYNKELGGGALIDAGGYAIRLATMMLEGKSKIRYAQMNYIDEFDVDLYGSGALSDSKGNVIQIAYGMDNGYKCELEIWGSTGSVYSGRILTAPVGFIPTVTLTTAEGTRKIELSSDDTFKKSIEYFMKCILDQELREEEFHKMIAQAKLVDEYKEKANNEKL